MRPIALALVLCSAAHAGAQALAPGQQMAWQPTGTLGFRLRASRTIRFCTAPGGKKLLAAHLLRTPILDIRLEETKRHPRLRLGIHAAPRFLQRRFTLLAAAATRRPLTPRTRAIALSFSMPCRSSSSTRSSRLSSSCTGASFDAGVSHSERAIHFRVEC